MRILVRGENVPATATSRMGAIVVSLNPMIVPDGRRRGVGRTGRLYFKGAGQNVHRHSGWHECFPEDLEKPGDRNRRSYCVVMASNGTATPSLAPLSSELLRRQPCSCNRRRKVVRWLNIKNTGALGVFGIADFPERRPKTDSFAPSRCWSIKRRTRKRKTLLSADSLPFDRAD